MAETPLTPEQIAAAEAKASKEGYLKREAVALDQFANATADGKLDETISARSGRDAKQGKWWAKALIWGLDLLQKDHGEKAAAGDLERAQAAEETEQSALKPKP